MKKNKLMEMVTDFHPPDNGAKRFEGWHKGCDYLAGKTEKGAWFCNKCGFYKEQT